MSIIRLQTFFLPKAVASGPTTKSVTDSLAVGMTDALNTISATLNLSDPLPIGFSDIVSISTSLSLSDTLPVGLTDTVVVQVTIPVAVTDALPVGLIDSLSLQAQLSL